MAVIRFSRNVCLLVVLTLLVTMSLDPVHCAMTVEQSIVKLFSAKYVLLLTEVTLADDHIRATAIDRQLGEAQTKYDDLDVLRNSLLQMDAHEPVPSPYEKTVQEMENALGRLPPLASLDPFLAQILDKCTKWPKPLSELHFTRTSLEHYLAQNPDNQAVSRTLAFYNQRYQVIQGALDTFELSLRNYRAKWAKTQVRPRKVTQRPVGYALEMADQAFRENFGQLFPDKSEPTSFPWLQVAIVLATLAIVILLVGILALWICFCTKQSTWVVSKRSPTSGASTMTDTSAAAQGN